MRAHGVVGNDHHNEGQVDLSYDSGGFMSQPSDDESMGYGMNTPASQSPRSPVNGCLFEKAMSLTLEESESEGESEGTSEGESQGESSGGSEGESESESDSDSDMEEAESHQSWTEDNQIQGVSYGFES